MLYKNELYIVLNECHEPSASCLAGMLDKGASAAGAACWRPEVACAPAAAPASNVARSSTSADLPPPSVAFAFAALSPATFPLLFEGPAGAAVVVLHQHKIEHSSR